MIGANSFVKSFHKINSALITDPATLHWIDYNYALVIVIVRNMTFTKSSSTIFIPRFETTLTKYLEKVSANDFSSVVKSLLSTDAIFGNKLQKQAS